LNRYLRGELDIRERQQVDEWFDSFGYSTDIEPLRDREKVDRLHRRLHAALEQYAGAKGAGPQGARPIVKQLKRRLPVVAAMILAVLGGFGIWTVRWGSETRLAFSSTVPPQYDTLRTEAGNMKRVELTEGSVLWLNAGTQVRYNPRTFRKQREIILDRGEVFFQVSRNASSPFTVRAGDLRTTVLGTAFNVKNYPELSYESVHVKEGKVAVSVRQHATQDTLSAGRGVKYKKAEGILVRDDRFASDAGSWTEGRTLLDNATFEELALVMQHRFGVTLKTQLPQASTYRYTITILQQTPLDETLRLICDIHQTNYRRKGNEITVY